MYLVCGHEELEYVLKVFDFMVGCAYAAFQSQRIQQQDAQHDCTVYTFCVCCYWLTWSISWTDTCLVLLPNQCLRSWNMETLHAWGMTRWHRMMPYAMQQMCTSTFASVIWVASCLFASQCGLQGCKNWSAPLPSQMSYKATKPGLALSGVYLSMFYCTVVY